MIKKLAQGNGWELTHETHKHTLDRTYLRLQSEYGVIEIKTFDATMLHALEKVEREYNKLKEQGPIKEGPLAELAKALAYHHEMVNGWARLASEGGTYDKLYVEFVRMREVVTHYEYVAQRLLGINPSPMADLDVR